MDEVAPRLFVETADDAGDAATPTYLDGTLRERLPRETGAAVVVDDAVARTVETPVKKCRPSLVATVSVAR